MKLSFLIAFFFTGMVAAIPAFAVNAHLSHPANTVLSNSSLTVNDFISFDVKEYRTPDGKKLSWSKRLGMKMLQHHLEKQVRKGKLEGNADFASAMKGDNPNKRGLASLIFSSLGLIFLFLPFLPILGLGLSIAGFVIGIIGLKRDEDTTMALIGVILGGLALFIYLLAVVVVAAWLSWI